jgi:serine/threonine protein kinase
MVQTEKPSIFYPFVQTPYIGKKYYIDELKLCGINSCFFTLYDINSKKKNKYYGIKIFKNKKEFNGYYILNNLRQKKLCLNAINYVYDLGEVLNFNETYYYAIVEIGIIDFFDFINLLNKKININNKNKIKLELNIIKLLIDKIKCLHDNNILHLDVKPENVILVNSDENNYDIDLYEYGLNLETNKISRYIIIKYIDFGMSVETKESKTYISEELLGTKNYNIPKNKLKVQYFYPNEKKKNIMLVGKKNVIQDKYKILLKNGFKYNIYFDIYALYKTIIKLINNYKIMNKNKKEKFDNFKKNLNELKIDNKNNYNENIYKNFKKK